MTGVKEELEAAGFRVENGKVDCGALGQGEVVDVRRHDEKRCAHCGAGPAGNCGAHGAETPRETCPHEEKPATEKPRVRALIFGGREYAEVRKWGSERSQRAEQEARADREKARLWQILDAAIDRLGITEIVEGGATGADRQARYWAKERGIPFETEPAEWDTHGKAAGPIRNSLMLEKYKPDLAIGFPGGDGTADMAGKVEAAGIRLIKVDWK